MKQLTGRLRSLLGWLTGDRRTEAKGRVMRQDAGSVDKAEQRVRAEHGDIGPPPS